MGNELEAFSAPPFGDWHFLVRKHQDLSTKFVRKMIEVYRTEAEPMVGFMRRAYSLLRLCIEEAVRWDVMGQDEPVLQEAVLALMLSMRNFEMSALPAEAQQWAIYSTMTEVNLRKMGTDILLERSCITILPSFDEAMADEDMRMELLSLLPMRMMPGAVAMSEAQILARGEAQGSSFEGYTVEGRASSPFDGLMHGAEL